MAKAEVRWVTHAGKHIPIAVNSKSSTAKSSGNKATAKGEQSGPNVAQADVGTKGIGGKIQLAKKDELKSMKGPKTKGGKK